MFIEWQVHLVLHLFAFFIHMHNWVICMCLKPVYIFRIVTRKVKKASHFIEPKWLLLCSEESTTVAYFEPGESTPHHTTPSYLLKREINTILLFMHRFLKWSLSFRYSEQNLYTFIFPDWYVPLCHVTVLIMFGEQYK